jgi:hypothetical protein
MKSFKLKFIFIIVIFFCILITVCFEKLSAYDSKQAVANGDVVSVHGKTTNLNKLDDFMSKIYNGEKGSVRITKYTNEGDAIITDLNFNGKIIECDFDTRRDKFSSKNDRKIMKYKFTKFNKEIRNDMVVYFFTDDNNLSRRNILTVDSN